MLCSFTEQKKFMGSTAIYLEILRGWSGCIFCPAHSSMDLSHFHIFSKKLPLLFSLYSKKMISFYVWHSIMDLKLPGDFLFLFLIWAKSFLFFEIFYIRVLLNSWCKAIFYSIMSVLRRNLLKMGSSQHFERRENFKWGICSVVVIICHLQENYFNTLLLPKKNEFINLFYDDLKIQV